MACAMVVRLVAAVDAAANALNTDATKRAGDEAPFQFR